jgi:predicted RNA-binding Zn-ribbon protein involved in translation (DUF1610 family)
MSKKRKGAKETRTPPKQENVSTPRISEDDMRCWAGSLIISPGAVIMFSKCHWAALEDLLRTHAMGHVAGGSIEGVEGESTVLASGTTSPFTIIYEATGERVECVIATCKDTMSTLVFMEEEFDSWVKAYKNIFYPFSESWLRDQFLPEMIERGNLIVFKPCPACGNETNDWNIPEDIYDHYMEMLEVDKDSVPERLQCPQCGYQYPYRDLLISPDEFENIVIRRFGISECEE